LCGLVQVSGAAILLSLWTECSPNVMPIDALSYRLLSLISFIAYMAAIYVTLHIVVAQLIRTRGSRLLWFFSVLTAPLTQSIRRLVPGRCTESQIRYVTLAACVVVWVGIRLLLALLGRARYVSGG
jgi:hypothetical protein